MTKKSLTKLLFILRIDLYDVMAAFLALVFLLAIIPVITYAYFAQDLEPMKKVLNRNNTGLVLYDSQGEVFFKFYEAEYSSHITISEVPQHTIEAILAAEDKGFYQHPGFSVRAIAAALIADIKHGDLVYGGSTITQQLAKNSFLDPDKSFLRKYQELVLAQELERRYNKNEILEMYLNSAYFGEGAFGIDAAARTYFDIPASQLTLTQSALLAGLLASPSRYSPFTGDEQLGIQRQHYILGEMLQQNFITQQEKEEAEKEELSYSSQPHLLPYSAPHFALMVRDDLIERYGEEQVIRSGFEVYTTIDLEWQKEAEEAVKKHLQNLGRGNASNAAVVVIDPDTGEIKALVGSVDWSNDEFGKINMALSPRQPGSAFKPVVYLGAFANKVISPATVLKDQPIEYQLEGGRTYKPLNYDSNFRGQVLTRRALANSLNVPSVEVLDRLGLPAAMEMAKKLGITSLGDPSNYGLSFVLGAAEVPLLELTGSYSVFANQGKYNPPTAILEIKDKWGNTIYNYLPPDEQVVEEEYTFLISSILSDKNARRETFGSRLDVSRPAAVKTGTSENYRDALTVGYTPSLAIGVWVGNSNYEPMGSLAGAFGAAPIWRELMEKFHQGIPPQDFEKPDGVVSLTVCRNNGLVLKEASPSTGYTEHFAPGTEPTKFCVAVETPKNQNYQQGGWYPVGANGQALQYWDGKWYDKPR